MTHEEAVAFIRDAVAADGIQYWADLGCGNGTFTRALVELLPADSHVTAVDRQKQDLRTAGADFIRADFEKDQLELSDLDGILIANALHYVAYKDALVRKLEHLFADTPRFIIIEYDTDRSNPWVPYPLSFKNLKSLFGGMGYRNIEKVNERRSTYGSGRMYCALVE